VKVFKKFARAVYEQQREET